VLVTGVPVNIHRYFDLTRAKLILARVELQGTYQNVNARFKSENHKPVSNELRLVGDDAVKLGFR